MLLESCIVFCGFKSYGCPVGGHGILGVVSDFDPNEMEFGAIVEFDILNNFPKFGCDQLINGFAQTRTKKIG